MEAAHTQELEELRIVKGDPTADGALLDELCPSIDGNIKYSQSCYPSPEIMMSFTAHPQDFIDVQNDMKVLFTIVFEPYNHLWVYLQPLNMVVAKKDKSMADLELNHASQLITFHVWCVDRDLRSGRDYPNLKMSMGRYWLGCGEEFRAWKEAVRVSKMAKRGVGGKGEKEGEGEGEEQVKKGGRPVRRRRTTLKARMG